MVKNSMKGDSMFKQGFQVLLVLTKKTHGPQFLDQRKAEHRMNGVIEAVFFIEPGVSQPYTLDRILTESD